MATVEEPCTFCKGVGNTKNVFKTVTTCPVCKGTGKLPKETNEEDTKKAD